ncbi:MAG: PQQ-dependent dehydrogenase, methanol/ethanol family, partial [Vicinamibacterales bacterium]
VLIVAGCGKQPEPAPVTTAKPTALLDAARLSAPADGEWLTYGRTYDEQRFSPLTKVDAGNVAQLSLAWSYDLDTVHRVQESTPLVIDGVMYVTSAWSKLFALDSRTGKEIWRFDPKVPGEVGVKACCDVANRGVAAWNGRIYLGTLDGRLIALEASTGKQVWEVMTVPAGQNYTITGAPRVFDGKVIIGNGGAELGARGYVTAYDAETGKQSWRFYIVPGNPADGFENEAMRMAAKTWTGEWWLHGGGGNAWHGFTYDPELDQLYIGTGNGSPWNRKIRSPEGGDNLFLCSIVALNPDTGEYRWHYQTTPGETWDFNSNMDIVLADLPIEGSPRKVILHAPKNGFFYVIDRTSGKLISAEPFTRTTWATRIDKETGRPIEVEGARYERGVATVAPTPIGAHSWHAMSFNPKTGLAYYPAMHLTATFNDKGFDPKTWRATPWSISYGVGGQFISGASRPGTSLSSLQAWDPVRQRVAWEVPMDGVFHPGTMTTAGNLVFQGRVDGSLRAYTADTGKETWRRDLGLGLSAPPITYTVNGKQYVAILVGWGGAMAGVGGPISAAHGWSYGVHKRYLVAFALDGKAALPVQPPPAFATPVKADFTVDPALAQSGAEVYARCTACHGPGAMAAGMAPDLRSSFVVTSTEQFTRVVRNGARAARGMPAYADITDRELTALQHYIRLVADAALRRKP